jgi:hypothetical protein
MGVELGPSAVLSHHEPTATLLQGWCLVRQLEEVKVDGVIRGFRGTQSRDMEGLEGNSLPYRGRCAQVVLADIVGAA